nr:LysR substrate-binding domain-containing protein [uncultured Pseudomonas sp.]
MARVPSLDALRTFLLAGTYLNVSRTADELCLTQSAVSRQLKLLEEQLEVQLFTRTNRGLALTEKGRQYFLQIQKPMAQIHKATIDLLPTQKTLVLGVDGAFAHTWLVKRLPRFRALHPDIELELRLSASMNCMTGSQLPAGCEVHIVFGAPPWPGYRSQALLALQEFPVCSPVLIGASTPLNKPADLLNQTMIHEGDRTTWRRWLAAANASDYESAKATMADDSLTCLSMAIDGQGVAIGDNLTCADYIESGALLKPFAETVVLNETFCLVVSEENSESGAVRAFCDWLTSVFSNREVTG